MDNREIIRLLAEKVMGWTESESWMDSPTFRLIANEGFRVFDHSLHSGRWWNPLISIADAYEMEGALPEELRWPYVYALWNVAGESRPFPEPVYEWRTWAMIHATPEQRCGAAVAALKAGGRP